MLFIDRTSLFRLASLHSVSVLCSWTLFFSLALNVYAISTTYGCPPLPGSKLTTTEFTNPEDLVNLPSRLEKTILDFDHSFLKYTKPELNNSNVPEEVEKYLQNMEDAMKLGGSDAISRQLSIFKSTASAISKYLKNSKTDYAWKSREFDYYTLPTTRTPVYYSKAGGNGDTKTVLAIIVRLYLDQSIKRSFEPSPQQSIAASLALFRVMLGLEALSDKVHASRFYHIEFHFLLDGRIGQELLDIYQIYKEKRNEKVFFLIVDKVGFLKFGSTSSTEEYFSRSFKASDFSYGIITRAPDSFLVSYHGDSPNLVHNSPCGYLALATDSVNCTMFSGSQNPSTLDFDPVSRFNLSNMATSYAVDSAVQFITRFILANAIEYSQTYKTDWGSKL